jgi:hypothetical protein
MRKSYSFRTYALGVEQGRIVSSRISCHTFKLQVVAEWVMGKGRTKSIFLVLKIDNFDRQRLVATEERRVR